MRIQRLKTSIIAALSAILLLGEPADAQPSKQVVAQKLAGAQTRDWIKVRETVFMGGSKCQAGERWRFGRDGKLQIRTCVQERWRVSTHNWELQPDGSLDYRLIISPMLADSGRRVRFRNEDQMLILRKMPGEKTLGVQDLELRRAPGSPPAF